MKGKALGRSSHTEPHGRRYFTRGQRAKTVMQRDRGVKPVTFKAFNAEEAHGRASSNLSRPSLTFRRAA